MRAKNTWYYSKHYSVAVVCFAMKKKICRHAPRISIYVLTNKCVKCFQGNPFIVNKFI